jgi:hypothetical protein
MPNDIVIIGECLYCARWIMEGDLHMELDADFIKKGAVYYACESCAEDHDLLED